MDANSEFVFRCIDRILGIILPHQENAHERVLVLSALSQRNVSLESCYCYRQINPTNFLNTIGIDFVRIEQCMTSDGHVFFSKESERDRGVSLLSKANVNGQKAFFVEKDSNNPLKLFYQVGLEEKLDESALLKFEGFEIPFFSQFAIYAKRTGAHVPTGFYFAKGLSFPQVVNNSEVFSHVWER